MDRRLRRPPARRRTTPRRRCSADPSPDPRSWSAGAAGTEGDPVKQPSPARVLLALVGLVAVDDLAGDRGRWPAWAASIPSSFFSAGFVSVRSPLSWPRRRVLDGDRAVHRGLHGLQAHRRGVDLHAHRRLEDVETRRSSACRRRPWCRRRPSRWRTRSPGSTGGVRGERRRRRPATDCSEPHRPPSWSAGTTSATCCGVAAAATRRPRALSSGRWT